MKVLHVTYYGYGGFGGAVATRRLHFGLRKAGIDSSILCVEGAKPSEHIIGFQSRRERKLAALLGKATSQLGLRGIDGVGSLRLKKKAAYTEADVVNFQRVFDSVSYLALPWLTKDKPAVFTHHDMWAYTGHCYYSLDCERWKSGCGHCPYLHIPPVIRIDNTRLEWKLKDWAYRHSNLAIVSKCTWSTEQMQQSMLNRFPIYQIPNSIDIEVYKPIAKEVCRSFLGIPKEKKVLMFGAVSLKHYIKGPDLLLNSLQDIPNSLKNNIVLLIMGHDGDMIADTTDIQTINLGYINNEQIKSALYSAADLFLCPSRAEVMPLVLLESMACGTPIVSFRVGGIPDLVRPGMTGYLAEPEDTRSFREGLIQLLQDDALRHDMRQHCRTLIEEEFSLDLEVEKSIQLYQDLLKA